MNARKGSGENMYTMKEVLEMADERAISIREVIEIRTTGRYTDKSGKNGHLNTIVTNFDIDFLKWHDDKKYEHIPWNMIGQDISETVKKEFAIELAKTREEAVEYVLKEKQSGRISAEEAIVALQKWLDSAKASD